ncbi:Glycosyltransferase involved in cell wall bisynthesis [Desulfatibacillum alkenivorans DSM 16219]|jgi:glycosyltransferase involved in cell wall biosynthesis|uniref:Glycosyltransferase involved in cell wall bisynthesis n=1 Tax=Desulfatibacillum alkenivorans DSM 16219 TaxID=1121393 RepID=A0A1M6I8W5_9BACT|nr:glycosyltransferase family 4 protein [Desulfatibacillum alkenivorans]SHJ30867.1 Glycosyltransferase involved in cell wall bisynthesis [Desulfatibacillum alkenivorans DSM 16219]
MGFRVIFSSPTYGLSGVNTAVSNLIRELNRRGHDARLLLTNPTAPDPMPMPAPHDAPAYFLPARPKATLKARQKALLNYLESLAPCIYVPGYDFDHSRICPALSKNVMVCGVVHSDDPAHYDHVQRLGASWNAAVCVSRAIAARVKTDLPDLASRVHVIPSGVAVTSLRRGPARPGAILRIIYTGRLIHHQKRIMDLAALAEKLEQRHVPYSLTIIGGGPQAEELKKALATQIKKGVVTMTGTLPNDQVLRHLVEHDALVLTSGFEGTPVSLLEAMAAGCVPVVTDIPSGIPELVEDGVNGFCVPVGDMETFAKRLEFLAHDPELRTKLADQARESIRGSRFSLENVAQAYLDLFDIMARDRDSGAFQRPMGSNLRLTFEKIFRLKQKGC